MVRIIVSLLLISIGIPTAAQINKCGPPCGGMNILDVGIHIVGMEVRYSNTIPYSEISANTLKKGFIVQLSDTTYKVKWFLIGYNNNKENKEYPVSGNKATVKNASFIKKVKPGDQIYLECINIQKGEETSLSTGLWILVTK